MTTLFLQVVTYFIVSDILNLQKARRATKLNRIVMKNDKII